jgi:GNAT superfamily N-acetyltransferase
MKYRIIKVTTKRLLKQFINLPWKIYRDYPFWVPPLRAEIREKCDPGKNAFFEYGKIQFLGVVDKNHTMAARGTAILNPLHNSLYNDKTGFFGLFESIHDRDAVSCLWAGIVNELRKWGCDTVIGPVNFTTNDENGFLLKGVNKHPVFMTNYCPPYYHDFMQALGLEKAIDQLSYEWNFNHQFPREFISIVKKLNRNPHIRIRSFNRKKMDTELSGITALYNESFKGVWGFVPITHGETEEMARAFRLFADDNLVLFAEYRGTPIGFCLSLPDINELIKPLNGRLFPAGIFRFLFKKHTIKTARVIVLCVHPDYRASGAAVLLIHSLHQRGKEGGYKKAELSVIMENNKPMRDVLEKSGFTPVKVYRLYRQDISNHQIVECHET